MTDYGDHEAILAVIEHAIEVTRQNPEREEATATNGYLAWCVLNELRRAGWSIVPISS